MNYVRCVDNKAYLQLPDQEFDSSETTTLTVGKVYKVAKPEPNDGDMLRIFDDSAEDYLFPADYFEPYAPNGDTKSAVSLSVHTNAYLKNLLHAEALAAHKSVSALLREWIEERLDLAV